MTDIFKSIDIISLDNEDNVILCFNDNKKIKINKNKFNEDEINKIKNKNYCAGCMKISNKGYFGSKKSWCGLSRKITNYI